MLAEGAYLTDERELYCVLMFDRDDKDVPFAAFLENVRTGYSHWRKTDDLEAWRVVEPSLDAEIPDFVPADLAPLDRKEVV